MLFIRSGKPAFSRVWRSHLESLRPDEQTHLFGITVTGHVTANDLIKSIQFWIDVQCSWKSKYIFLENKKKLFTCHLLLIIQTNLVKKKKMKWMLRIHYTHRNKKQICSKLGFSRNLQTAFVLTKKTKKKNKLIYKIKYDPSKVNTGRGHAFFRQIEGTVCFWKWMQFSLPRPTRVTVSTAAHIPKKKLELAHIHCCDISFWAWPILSCYSTFDNVGGQH